MIVALAAVSASAQKVNVGVRAGLNFANITSEGESASTRTAFHAGVVFDVPVAEKFFVQPGLFLTQKGCKQSLVEDGVTMKASITPLYFEVPVLASYRFPVSGNTVMQINAGPYVAYGLSGSIEVEGKESGKKASASVGLFNEEYAKRFDAGLQIGAGFTFSQKYYMGLAYEFGLTNISQDSEDTMKNGNLMLSVGYNF